MGTNQDCANLKSSLLPHYFHLQNDKLEDTFENIFLDLMTGIHDYEEWNKIGLDIWGDGFGSGWTKQQQFTIQAPLRYENLYNKTAVEDHEFWRFISSCHESDYSFQNQLVAVNSCEEIQNYTAETRGIITSLTPFDVYVLGRLQFQHGTEYVIEKLSNVSSVDYETWPFLEYLGDYCMNGHRCKDIQIEEHISQMIARMMLMIRYSQRVQQLMITCLKLSSVNK